MCFQWFDCASPPACVERNAHLDIGRCTSEKCLILQLYAIAGKMYCFGVFGLGFEYSWFSFIAYIVLGELVPCCCNMKSINCPIPSHFTHRCIMVIFLISCVCCACCNFWNRSCITDCTAHAFYVKLTFIICCMVCASLFCIHPCFFFFNSV